ncbi:hypothetical protein D3C86_1787970 [compost metagenome]
MLIRPVLTSAINRKEIAAVSLDHDEAGRLKSERHGFIWADVFHRAGGKQLNDGSQLVGLEAHRCRDLNAGGCFVLNSHLAEIEVLIGHFNYEAVAVVLLSNFHGCIS